LDIPPLKLLDAVKHSVEDKRFFLSEQLLNVGERIDFQILQQILAFPSTDLGLLPGGFPIPLL